VNYLALPEGYTINRRTLEEGGGWLLKGGVNNYPRNVRVEKKFTSLVYDRTLGSRNVCSFAGDPDPELVRTMATFDHLSRYSLSENERKVAMHEFTKLTKLKAGLGLDQTQPAG
jgi:hypothetical protein